MSNKVIIAIALLFIFLSFTILYTGIFNSITILNNITLNGTICTSGYVLTTNPNGLVVCTAVNGSNVSSSSSNITIYQGFGINFTVNPITSIGNISIALNETATKSSVDTLSNNVVNNNNQEIADNSTQNSLINAKASTSYVDDGLSNKPNLTNIAGFANQTNCRNNEVLMNSSQCVNTSAVIDISSKANQTDFQYLNLTQIADNNTMQTFVLSGLSAKMNLTDLSIYTTNTALNSGLSGKVNLSQIVGFANDSDVTSRLSAKANQSDLQNNATRYDALYTRQTADNNTITNRINADNTTQNNWINSIDTRQTADNITLGARQSADNSTTSTRIGNLETKQTADNNTITNRINADNTTQRIIIDGKANLTTTNLFTGGMNMYDSGSIINVSNGTSSTIINKSSIIIGAPFDANLPINGKLERGLVIGSTQNQTAFTLWNAQQHHNFTLFANMSPNEFGFFSASVEKQGGLLAMGISDEASPRGYPMNYLGIFGSSTPDNAFAAVTFAGGKYNGAGSVTTMANNETVVRVQNLVSSVPLLVIKAAGWTGIRCDQPTYDLYIGGTGKNCSVGTWSRINAGSSTFTVSSSASIKENFVNTTRTNLTDRIMKLEPMRYDFKKTFEKRNVSEIIAGTNVTVEITVDTTPAGNVFGLTAENAYDAFKDDPLYPTDNSSIDYSYINMMLLTMVQEQQKQIIELKTNITNLQDRVAVIESKLGIITPKI